MPEACLSIQSLISVKEGVLDWTKLCAETEVGHRGSGNL